MLKSLSQRGIFGLLVSLLSISIVMAQTSCPELVQSALSAFDQNCSSAARNQLCYGYEETEASFLSSVDDEFFSETASLVPTSDLESFSTSPLNSSAEQWGLAVMKLQANLPNALPDQNLVFVSMGDIELENGVQPEAAFVPDDGIEVTIIEPAGANVRSGPGTDFNVIGGLGKDETVIADGISEDAQWLRVVYGQTVGWVNISLIDNSVPNLGELPTLTDDLRMPMQSFYMRGGINEAECNETPDDILLVQGPRNIKTIFSVNGAEIRLGSSGALRIIMIDEQLYLEIIVFDGTFEVDGKLIHERQRSVLCLGDEQSRGLDGLSNDLIVTCEASDPETIDPVEFAEEWCVLEDVPASILNYQLDIRCLDELSNTNNTSGSESEIAAVDCSEFSIQTRDIPATNFTLSWSPAAGANSYDVAIYDNTGYQTALHTGITGTSIHLNGGVGFASAGWIDVRAFLGGEYACYTRMNFNRSGDPNEESPDVSVGDIAINASCYYDNGYMKADVSWHGLASGETISATLDVGVFGSASDNSSSGSGSLSMSVYTDNPRAATINVNTSDGSHFSASC